jgi:Glycosyl hydrolase family 26
MKAPAFLLSVLTLTASATEVITNFDFENGPQSWIPAPYLGNTSGPNTPLPASPPLPAPDYQAVGCFDPNLPPVSLPKAVRLTGRRWHSEGIYQNVIGNLPVSPNPAGEPYRFKLKIRVEADVCFVRCLLTFVNTVPNPDVSDVPFIVAEKVIRTTVPGQWQWVEVEGVKNIRWPTSMTPNEARISIDVGQVYKEKLNGTPTAQIPNPPPTYLPYPSGMWPSYTLDSISMEPDLDLDGLSDAEEAALVPPTLADNPDSDSDGLPDKWEVDHELLWAPSPGAPTDSSNDRDGDPDHDGYSHWQEYWAATDPNNEESFPGNTANANATPATKAVARMLALAPSKGKHLVGQTVNDVTSEYQSCVVALADRVQADTGTARWPAIISLSIESLSQPVNFANSAPIGRAYATSGHLVVAKWAMWNPWTGGSVGSQGTIGQVDIPALVDPASANYNTPANLAARTIWLGWLDSVAVELAKFIDPAFGGHPDNVVIFRPMSEMTGDWDWFGHRTHQEYTALWHFIYHRFTVEKQLNHLLWCYESAQSEHHFLNAASKPVPADYYYPGDAETDIMGHNFYDDDWVLPNDLNQLFRSYPKIYAFPQAGVDKNKADPDKLFDNLNYPLRIAASFPRCSFFIPWSTYTTNGGSVVVHQAIISNPNPSEMMTHPAMVTDGWMTPWQTWAHTHLGTLAAPMIGDTDHDGLGDVLEYALGTPPLAPNIGNAVSIHLPDPAGPLDLTFSRNPTATDADFTIEGSTDLIGWQPLARSTGGGPWEILAGGSIHQAVDYTVTFTDHVLPAGGPRFLRLGTSVP